jgi:hypothetical protein
VENLAPIDLPTLRLGVIDRKGTIWAQSGVELCIFDIVDTVQDGDWVEITRHPKEAELRSFMSLSTGAQVRSKRVIPERPLA